MEKKRSKEKKSKFENSVTLARALSKLGYCSRSQAVLFIQDGNVLVNGKVTTNPSQWCNLKTDKIVVTSIEGNQELDKKKFMYIMMNKPKGVITTRSDELGRKTIYDFLSEIPEWIFPVGRLDKESSGLLLLTNDNQMGERLTNPDSKVPKKYMIQIDKVMRREDISTMTHGMMLDDEQLLPVRVSRVEMNKGEYWLEMIITEGKNRQIRRMFEACGYKVLELVRTEIGNLSLGNLRFGEYKVLTDREVRMLVS